MKNSSTQQVEVTGRFEVRKLVIGGLEFTVWVSPKMPAVEMALATKNPETGKVNIARVKNIGVLT